MCKTNTESFKKTFRNLRKVYVWFEECKGKENKGQKKRK